MFYSYHQNNSGGTFYGPAIWVIVEADTANEADAIAEENGVYFNGCSTGEDCSCCGDRWSRQWGDDEGTEEPEIYGKSPEDSDFYGKGKGRSDADYIIIRKNTFIKPALIEDKS